MYEDNGCPTTAVAIDRDKNSRLAVKWAVNNLASNPTIILIHVRPATPQGYGSSEGSTSSAREQMDTEVAELFKSYRLYCVRKGMKVKEVLLDETDVGKAIVEYINSNHIMNMVAGASNRNALTRKFRNPDVPTLLTKTAPDFCTVYIIWKGKTMNVRPAKNQTPNIIPSPRQTMIPASPRHSALATMDSDGSTRGGALRSPWRATIPSPSSQDRRGFDRNADFGKTPNRYSGFRDSFQEDLDFNDSSPSYQSVDFGDSLELSSNSYDSPTNTSPQANKDLEAEMKRLKLELRQTMLMYSTACREAITAKQKTWLKIEAQAKELHQWKLEDARRLEEARQAEEAALAIAEMEKSRCRVAMEAAETAKRIAELEAKKRLNAELAVQRESEEKKRALDALAQTDVRYRRYSIDEIEAATDNFATGLKIGEGGYGPVYRATLDHTPVAIKVLRPDAAQGRKQFQQEVEVLSSIRHPNMVLLLGACPDYGCLVYEYMENGSLDDRLFQRGNSPPIPWSIRFKIAAEIATGLLFLHQTKPEPLVHRDLKPGNILLDRNYVSKISDVGLARLVPPSVTNAVTQYRMTSTAGTFCYIDPEYQQTGMLGIKSDIYSLGILLLQIITARPPMGLTHHVERAIAQGKFQDILDPTVMDWPIEEALSFAKLALKCAKLRRKDRPDLGKVILPELNRLRDIGEWSTSSSSNSSGSTPNSYTNTPPRPWSHIQQEFMRSNPHSGFPWSKSDMLKTSGSSAAI